MTTPKRDNRKWEKKWRARTRGRRLDESYNGLPVPKSVFSDPRYKQIKSALPKSMRTLFDEYIQSLIQPRKSQE